ISVDNKELIVCACRKDNKRKPDYNNCDLYGTKYERVTNPTTGKLEYKWGELVNLGPNINTPEGWEAQPSLSADGRTLYFAVVRETPGQDPNMDIYYSTRDDKGNWTPAKPLAAINTSGNEKTPFMHSDSKTLYFSAEVGEKYWGAGGYDIFFTRQKADGSWTTPQNIGYPINSTEDEPGMIVSTDGKLAYYSSSKLKGSKGYDIYRFELPEFARPEKVIIVKGQVTDENGDPLANAKIEISYTGDNKKEIVKVDPTDGKYAAVVNVQNGNDAVVTVKAEDRTFDSKLIAANSSTVVKAADLKAEKLEIGKAYTIKDILFASNSFELSAASKFVIDQFIVFLKENPNIKIAIHGHTDDRGVPAENLKLSDNRAKAVMDYIVSKGVAANRLSAQGFGQNKPKAPNTSEENRRQNRRTEFVIVAK
ncbi:MAG TPA: OmpA family protein, partial [Flavobacteriales bacterium]|nr:OmpA family protein [Flavobacteriales bacterium]